MPLKFLAIAGTVIICQNNQMRLFFSIILGLILFTNQALAQATLIQDKVTIVKAEVLEIVSETWDKIVPTDAYGINQKLKVKILEGDDQGTVINLHNDFVKLKAGEIFWLRNETRSEDGSKYYAVSDQDRMPGIYFFTILFILAVIFFGGVQGVRGLVSLIGSLILILYVLLPGILAGVSPLLVTIGVSSLIIILGSYITHGFNKTTSSAVIGMIGTVLFTGALAYLAIRLTKLTGFSSEEETYLNLSLNGQIDMLGLFFGGIMIGLLGVLYDVAIGQAISVEELHCLAKTVPRRHIYKRAVRIGREHIGALVNTLAIAYVGVSLPLLLLFYSTRSASGISPLATINSEMFATEIVRILIGSIGLILAVPITTAISVWMLIPKNEKAKSDFRTEDLKKLEEFHHHH